MLSYHPTAKTTYLIRKEIHDNPNNLTQLELAKKFNITVSTVVKWQNRKHFEDAPHGAINPKKSITDLEEYIICELRKITLLGLDDLLDIINNFGIKITRSALDRALRRNDLANLKNYISKLNPEEKPKYKEFKEYEPGFLHIDIKYLPKIEKNPREYLFVAIDRATRLVYLEIFPNKTAENANIFMKNVIKFYPFEIKKVLTDNGKEFTDRFNNSSKKPTGEHIFDKTCTANDVEHRLTAPYTPKTNGMVERMNGKITENVLDKIKFENNVELKKTIMNYLYNYNHHIKHSGINRKTPIECLEKWFNEKPELFKVDIETFKITENKLYFNYYSRGLDN
jgi:transposase InsO family protein